MTSQQEQPVVIMGGGPAGIFTACGLTDLGIRAIVISRPRPFPSWEGLSERPRQSLQKFGFDKTLASLGPKVVRRAFWNGESRAQNQEYIVERRLFDQALLEDAGAKGVEVITGRVEKIIRYRDRWQLSCQTNEGPKTLTAGFVVEARGRLAKFGRKLSSSETVTAPATSALLTSYLLPQGRAAMTAVASFAKGWAWFLCDGNGGAILQIFVGSDRGDLPPKSGLEAFFSTLVRQLPEAEKWLDGATMENKTVSVRSAAATMTLPVGGKDFLVVGDGSLALDPLSGNGIFYAIGSGLAAAPTINSLIHRPKDGELALQFYRERIEHAFKGGSLSARKFYASEQRWPHEPFWQARSHWLPPSLPPDPAMIFCKKPVIKNGFIAIEDVIVTADYPRGVWQVDSVPLVRLFTCIKTGVKPVFSGVTAAQISTAQAWLASQNITD